MSHLTNLLLCAGLCLLSAISTGCESKAQFEYGEDLSALKLHPISATEGIYPDTTVLIDPNNPFKNGGPSSTGKWMIAGPMSNPSAFAVAAYYGWATVAANGYSGEPQFFTAQNAAAAYNAAMSKPDLGLISAEDLPRVRAIAIGAFQSVLDNFPNDVSYLPDGVTSYELATLSYKGIVALGGSPGNGWVLVTTKDNGEKAVKQ